jgi:hypothetical protein
LISRRPTCCTTQPRTENTSLLGSSFWPDQTPDQSELRNDLTGILVCRRSDSFTETPSGASPALERPHRVLRDSQAQLTVHGRTSVLQAESRTRHRVSPDTHRVSSDTQGPSSESPGPSQESPRALLEHPPNILGYSRNLRAPTNTSGCSPNTSGYSPSALALTGGPLFTRTSPSGSTARPAAAWQTSVSHCARTSHRASSDAHGTSVPPNLLGDSEATPSKLAVLRR